MRELEFYITDFDNSQSGFSVDDFDRLIKNGLISTDPNNSNISQSQDVSIEVLRNQFKPDHVKVLFVG